MKTLAVLAAALAISLACVGTASAQRFAGSSVSETRTITDAFGNKRSVTRRITDEGGLTCQTVTRRSQNASGDTASRTERRCAADY